MFYNEVYFTFIVWNPHNKEDIIAIVEVIEKKVRNLGMYEGLYYDCLQSEVNTAKKINTLKTLIDKGVTQKQWLKTCKS